MSDDSETTQDFLGMARKTATAVELLSATIAKLDPANPSQSEVGDMLVEMTTLAIKSGIFSATVSIAESLQLLAGDVNPWVRRVRDMETSAVRAALETAGINTRGTPAEVRARLVDYWSNR